MTGHQYELGDHEASHRRGVGSVLAVVTTAVLAVTVWSLPRENAKLPAVAREAMTVAIPKWHTLEPVNEVVYGTRGFDTFGETFLLLAAVVGIGMITRGREARRGFIGEEVAGAREQSEDDPPDRDDSAEREARGAESEEQGHTRGPATPDNEALGTPDSERAEGMSVVVRGAVRTVSPVLAIAGLYLVAWGYSPGGGFPGGAVLLGVILFAFVAFGYRRIAKVVRPGLIEPIELLGAVAIIVIELLGLVFKGSFSANWLPLGQLQTIPSGGILQAFSSAELVEVATGLTLGVFGLLGMTHDWAEDTDDADIRGDAEDRR